jgi:hypothetical protein
MAVVAVLEKAQALRVQREDQAVVETTGLLQEELLIKEIVVAA